MLIIKVVTLWLLLFFICYINKKIFLTKILTTIKIMKIFVEKFFIYKNYRKIKNILTTIWLLKMSVFVYIVNFMIKLLIIENEIFLKMFVF